jgi:hypothetical protein
VLAGAVSICIAPVGATPTVEQPRTVNGEDLNDVKTVRCRMKLKHNGSPQAMSYVLPLLIAEGFCKVSDRKPFVIHKL